MVKRPSLLRYASSYSQVYLVEESSVSLLYGVDSRCLIYNDKPEMDMNIHQGGNSIANVYENYG